MSATPTQARDEMLGTFMAAWEADPASASVPVLFSDIAQDIPKTGAWVRVTVRHNEGYQATLANDVGSRRFRYLGTVFVQVFTPFDDGGVLNDQLVTIAKNAFQGVTTSPSRIWFQNVRINEVGQDGQWFQTNVLAGFEYDEIR